MSPSKPFQLLEINLISAQDLEPVNKKMNTYATAWMTDHRKLSSCVDTEGKVNPSWNDKFVFRVDEDFLKQDTSAIMIEIYAVHWLRDMLVGTVRVLVGNLIPPPSLSVGQGQMRFVALQVRRPSGRPQGILNIGVALLGSSMKCMPLYRQLSMSAIGIRDLMEDLQSNQQNENENDNPKASNVKPILRRSKSERSELMEIDQLTPSSSIVGLRIQPGPKESSILSITDGVNPFQGSKKVAKASSVINGTELLEKGKPSSIISDSIIKKEPHKKTRDEGEEKPIARNEGESEKPIAKIKGSSPNDQQLPVVSAVCKHVTRYKNKGGNLNSAWSDSEVGPSPSEVAEAMVAERKYPLDDNQTSVLDGWSADESMEGLKSKLHRWRMDLPPLQDRTGYSTSSFRSSRTGTSRGRQGRRHSDGSDGLFSCFGSIFGIECQCVCGKPTGKKRRSNSARFHSPSTLTPGRSFL